MTPFAAKRSGFFKFRVPIRQPKFFFFFNILFSDGPVAAKAILVIGVPIIAHRQVLILQS
jgi:hypothetical protein